MAAKDKDLNREEQRHNGDTNRDPITDEPGAHPVGTGAGGDDHGDRIDSRMSGTGDQMAGGGSMIAAGDRTNIDTGAGAAAMNDGAGTRTDSSRAVGAGEMKTAGSDAGDRGDVIDVLKDLVRTCFDGEYGFRACAEQASSAEIKSTLMQRAEDCRRGAQELADEIHALGGKVSDGGSLMGALERGWVAVRTTLSSYDDRAVLEECERGEDNAVERYRKALTTPLPANVRLIVERQLQGVQCNHDRIKMLRDRYRAAS